MDYGSAWCVEAPDLAADGSGGYDAMVAFAPGPAIAKTTDHQPPGPPSSSGGDDTKNNGSVVLHGDHPVCVVHNKNGLPTGYSGKCPIT